MAAIGERMGRYELVSLLGRGGMGEVWEAILHGPAGFRKSVALKLLRGAPKGERQRDRLVREARLGALLSHPNLVATHELGEHESGWFITMELVRGASVQQLCEGGPLPRDVVIDIGLQVCAGLSQLHGLRVDSEPSGLVHQDLKPANLLVDQSGLVKIADFGVTRFQSTHDHESGGTPGYLAPEQLSGESDARSDLFALGVVLYRIATGRRPFGVGTQAMVDVLDVEGVLAQPGFLEEADRAVAGLGMVVRKCLRFHASQRWSTAEELASALRALRPQHASGPTLLQLLRAANPALGPSEVAPVTEATTAKRRRGLPAPPDAFIGRRSEIAELRALLDQGRPLITLLGPGGMGKTRLAIEVARNVGCDWAGGATFCDFSEATDLQGVFAAIGRGLDLQLGRDPVAQIGDAMAAFGRALFVFDNAEQVAHLAQSTIGEWMVRAPDACFIVTSRTVLGLQGEARVTLGPLSTEEAVELFVERGVVARVDRAAEAGVLTTLVELLDNLPLAIELAAARATVLTPSQILERLRDRFHLLKNARGGRPKRQSALVATLDWSWDLLTAAEQQAFVQLSVFEGGFTLEAAEAVVDVSTISDAPWPVDLVQALVEKSVLRVLPERGTDVRFGMYLSIAEYARAKLGPAMAPVAARHGRYFGRFGTPEAVIALDAWGGVARRRSLSRELDNLLVAFRRAVAAGDGELAALLADAVWGVVADTGPFPLAETLADTVLAMVDVSTLARARMLALAAGAARISGAMDRAKERAEQGMLLVASLDGHSARGVAASLHARLGLVHADRGNFELARPLYDRALALFREVGHRLGEGGVLGNLAALLLNLGRLDDAWQHYNLALAVHREIGNRRFEGIVLGNLGGVLRELGQRRAAYEQYLLALEIDREVANRASEGWVLSCLGLIDTENGRLQAATDHLTAALGLLRKVGHRRYEAIVSGHLAALEVRKGHFAEARPQIAAALAVHRAVGNRLHQAGALGLLAEIDLGLGELEQAEAHLMEGLVVCRTLGEDHLEGVHLGLLGVVLTRAGHFERARAAFLEAEPHLRHVPDPLSLGELLCGRVALELAMGRVSDARATLADAEAVVESCAMDDSAEVVLLLAAARREVERHLS